LIKLDAVFKKKPIQQDYFFNIMELAISRQN